MIYVLLGVGSMQLERLAKQRSPVYHICGICLGAISCEISHLVCLLSLCGMILPLDLPVFVEFIFNHISDPCMGRLGHWFKVTIHSDFGHCIIHETGTVLLLTVACHVGCGYVITRLQRPTDIRDPNGTFTDGVDVDTGITLFFFSDGNKTYKFSSTFFRVFRG